EILIICGGVLLFISAIAVIILLDYLLEILFGVLFEFLLAKTSNEILAFLEHLQFFSCWRFVLWTA
ncbi:MAG: hypothetical protein ACR5KV_06400, partial [Wolbachia sp.]